MSNWVYTNAEKRAIDKAFDACLAIAECDHTAERMLRDALAMERRERRSITTAKALIVSSIANHRPQIGTIAGLFGVARGLQLAYILGAEWRRQTANGDHYRRNRFRQYSAALPKFRACQEAHDAYIARGLDRAVAGQTVS